LWASIGLAIVLVALVLDVLNRYEPIGIDFHTYLAAARVGVERGWSLIYDQNLVGIEQMRLVPDQIAQAFLSPPTDAWLTAPLAPLPYWVSYWIWAAITLAALVAALVWASQSRGLERWIIAGAAIAPWWVLHAVNLGQVAPLVAAGAALTTRLARERRDLTAGIALSLLYLKPNTALLIPFALLVAGRYRIFASWAAVGVVIVLVAFGLMGSQGVSAYLSQLRGPLPEGANNLTLEGALGVGGGLATALRAVIVLASLAAAYRLRHTPGLVIAVGAIGSLLVVPYLHGSDLCLFSVAAWIVWEERPTMRWRVPIAAGWLVSTPYINSTALALRLNRWTLSEVVLLIALAVVAVWSGGVDPRRSASASGS